MYIYRERDTKKLKIYYFLERFGFMTKSFSAAIVFFLKLEHLYSSSNQYVQFSLGIVSKKKPVKR